MKWKRIIGRTVAILAILTVVATVGGYFYLSSNSFRNLALHKIIEQVDQATGGRAQIRAIDFNLSTLTAHIHNLVLRGKESPDDPPLLAVDQITVGLKIESALRRKVSLSQLVIEHPVVHLKVDREGLSNLPDTPQTSGGNGSALTISHAALTAGEIDYNNQKIPMDADLHDLSVDVLSELLSRSYRGSISYDNGHLRYGQFAPLPHSLNARFRATSSDLSIEAATIKVGSSSIALHSTMKDFSNPSIVADYDIHLHTQDLASMSPSLRPGGDVSLTGQLRYRGENGVPWLRSVTLNGAATSNGLSADSPTARLDIRKLHGSYQFANATLTSNGIDADTLGGHVLFKVDIQHLDEHPASRVQAALRGVSLRSVQQSLRGSDLKRIAIAGTLDGIADAEWTGDINRAKARADLSIHAPTGSSSGASTLPLNGKIHAIYDGAGNTLALSQSSLQIPSATLTANGKINNRSDLQLHVAASDLRQLVALASGFTSIPPAVQTISGAATMDANVRGSLHRPQISAQAHAQNLRVQGSDWKTADATFQADPSRIEVSNGNLESAQSGRASFAGTVALRDWSYSPSNPIHANLSVQKMSVADLERIANLQYPVSGELSGTGSLSGSQLQPNGSGSFEIVKARVYDEPLQTVALRFHTQGSSIVSTLNIVANAGSANSSFTYTPASKAYTLRVEAPSIVLQKLHAVQAKNLEVNGTLSLSANGRGTFDNPQLSASLQTPRIDVRRNPITSMKASFEIANQAANLTLDSEVAQSTVRVRGHVNLGGDYESDASIDTTAVPLDVLLASLGNTLPQGFQGQTEFHATLKGPLKDKSRIEAHVTVPQLDASYQSLQLRVAGPIHADYSHSVVTLQPFEIRGTDTSVRVKGNIPLAGTTPADVTAQGSIDAKIFRIFSSDLNSSGTIGLDIRASGTSADPELRGQVRLQDIALSTPDAPLGVDKLNGTLDVTNDRVQLSGITGRLGGGQITAAGSVTYRPALQFDVALKGNSVRLLYPDGLRTLLDSNLVFSGNKENSTLTGRVLIDSLSFTPDFDLATFGDTFSSSVAVPAQPGFADSVGLRISLQSKNNLNARSSQVSVEGSANLQISGTAANPVITGRTDLTSGELFYRNVRYQLQRGIITFADPNQTSPVLDVSATTTIEQYNLTLSLRGPLDSLTTSYISDPPLATTDVINLIARGKTSSESAAASQSTDSMIASEAANQVAGSVQKLAGFSSLQIDPLLGGNNQNPSARIAIQQRVTKDFLFTFSTDVSQPGQELVQGDYQINKRWSVSVTRDQAGGVSVDGRFHTKF